MPLFEVETDAHIIITWADNEEAAARVLQDAYPGDRVIRPVFGRAERFARTIDLVADPVLGLTDACDDVAEAKLAVAIAIGCVVHGLVCVRRFVE